MFYLLNKKYMYISYNLSIAKGKKTCYNKGAKEQGGTVRWQDKLGTYKVQRTGEPIERVERAEEDMRAIRRSVFREDRNGLLSRER